MGDLASVDPAAIPEQRAKGWPDFHPEDYCHRCGRPNICWFTSSPDWNRATEVEGSNRLVILCPQCFVAAWEAATGTTSCWELRPTNATLTRLVGGEPPGVGDLRGGDDG